MDACERIIVLIDMDCFYVQVEQRRQPDIKGMPCAVVQYNKWKGGAIIAVSYEARAKGVSRNMRGDYAKEKCPDIVLCMVPTANEKADLTRYRDAGAEVIQVLLQFSGIVERASIDEAYIDLTEVVNKRMTTKQTSHCIPSLSDLQHTYVVGYPNAASDPPCTKADEQTLGLKEYSERSTKDENAMRLLIAAALVEEIRLAVYDQTTFRCSAGISHNKVLSKFACGINKPNKQTILPMESVSTLFKQVKISKIRNLGGKLGLQLSQNQGIEYIGQVTEISKSTLVKSYGVKTGEWLHEICRGIDREPVKERHVVQSVGCSKAFRGVEALNTRAKVKHWIACLVTELVQRLIRDREVNNRSARSLSVQIGFHKQKAISRACQISKYEFEDISRSIMATLELLNQSKDRKCDTWHPAIALIGISAGKFQSINGKSLFKADVEKDSRTSTDSLISSASESSSSKKSETSHCLKENEDISKVDESSAIDANVESAASNCETKLVNSAKLSPIYRNKSPKTNEKTTMDRKKLFFTQNFGVADRLPPTTSYSATEVKQAETNNKRNTTCKNSPSTTNVTEKKRSFFARMRENSAKETSCQIENAFEELTNMQNLEPTLTDTSAKIRSKPCPPSLPTVLRNSELEQTEEKESPDDSFNMDNIDMDVFNSLPLYLQQEIKSASRKSTVASTNTEQNHSDTKRRKVTPSCSQTSIAGFFKSPEKTTKTSNKKPIGNKEKTKSRKGALQFSCLEENAVPFGFFRARSQASAAIRNAVEKQALLAQKRKGETDENARCQPL